MPGREPETAIGGSKAAFQSTLWTLVLRAKNPDSPERRDALEKLIQTYWKPLYFFVRRKGNGTETSKDITQEFFTRLLEKDFLKYLDRERGKFRTFLLTALDHFMADEYDKGRALKRGGGRSPLSLDFQRAEGESGDLASPDPSPERAYKRDWAVHVMAQALERVRQSFAAADRFHEFEAFKGHLASTRPDGATYEDLATQLGVPVDRVRNGIRSARTAYREAILDVIRGYTETEAGAQEELRDLLSAFS